MKRFSVVRLAILVVGATGLALAVTACGGSNKSSSGSNSTATVTTTTATTTTTSTTGGSSSGGASTTETGTSTGSASGTGNVSKSCLEFVGIGTKLAEALGSTGSPSADTSKLQSYFNALADKAPSDIKSAFKTWADAFGKYTDALKGVNLQSPSADDVKKLQDVQKEISTPEVQAASQKIQAWVKAGCHS